MTTVLRAVVVGSGISGLTTAISLLEAGHSVRIVAAEPAMSTTSAVAAAVWFPTHVAPWERVSGWGEDTFGVLAEHAAAQVPGVIMRESLGLYREQPGEATWVGAVGGVRDARADELPPGYAYGLRYAVPLAEMPRYLPWLVARVRALGGQFTQRHLQSLDDVGHGADVVVNCAGLGASDLVGDASMYPVRGQIVRTASWAALWTWGNGTPRPTLPSVRRSWRGVPTWFPHCAVRRFSSTSSGCDRAARPFASRRVSG